MSRFAEQLDGRLSLSCSFCPEVGEEPASGLSSRFGAVIGSHRPFYVVIQMSSFASRFYGSPAWKSCRDAFRKSRGKLCERCLARGIINAGSKENPLQVHHKIKLTPDNIDDPSITLNWDNLETLCQDCHAAEHPHSFPVKPRKNNDRWSIGENGEVIVKPDTPLGSRP